MTNSNVLKELPLRSSSIIRSRRTVNIIVFAILTFFALVILIPFYVILITAFKTEAETMSPEFTWWPEQGFHLTAFDTILFNDVSGGGDINSTILLGFRNTLIIVLPATLLGLFSSSLSAYAFAKMRFPLKNTLFTILLLTMMIPGIIMLMPSYLIYDMLGFTDTYVPLMVPGMFGSAACVFFMRQFFYAIPTELVESAKIDGLSHFGIFWRIMVPLSMSGLIAQGVLGFVGGYNDYLGPLIYLSSPEKYTLQLALSMSVSTYRVQWNVVMAGSVIALVPMLILYVFAQKFFIEGIATTGLKV